MLASALQVLLKWIPLNSKIANGPQHFFSNKDYSHMGLDTLKT